MGKKWTLGIAISHNGSACLLQGNKVVVAIQEERLTRIKRHTTAVEKPMVAVEYCLQHAGIKLQDLDLVCICLQGDSSLPHNNVALNPRLREIHGKVQIRFVPHHLSHAAYVLALSGYQNAAVLVVDGIGSPYRDWTIEERAAAVDGGKDAWEWLSAYVAQGTHLAPLEKHTIGDLWSDKRPTGGMPTFWGFGGMYSAAAQVIFGDRIEGAGKVMGLAPFGTPVFAPGQFFDFVGGRFVFKDFVSKQYPTNLQWGQPDKQAENLAASVQNALEFGTLEYLKHLHARTGLQNLCLSGGCALNGVTNERIIRESAFKNVFIGPAAEDSGTSIGAAYAAIWQQGEAMPAFGPGMDFLGATYPATDVDKYARTLPVLVLPNQDPVAFTVDRLVKGKIAGWYQGGAEMGPRALGHRSILCAATFVDAKDRLNLKVKKRESFRPFAPVVLAEDVNTLFDMADTTCASPFMLRVAPFREEYKKRVPAVVHIDGTGRLQTVDEGQELLIKLLKAYKVRTGIGLLLNTSMNLAAEPLAETPEDALWDMLDGGLDFLVCGERIVQPAAHWDVLDLIPKTVGAFLGRRTHAAHFGQLYNGTTPNAMGVAFEITSPFGKWEQFLSTGTLQVANLCDGTKTGWEVVNLLPGEPGPGKDQSLRSLLLSLRRYRIITLTRR